MTSAQLHGNRLPGEAPPVGRTVGRGLARRVYLALACLAVVMPAVRSAGAMATEAAPDERAEADARAMTGEVSDARAVADGRAVADRPKPFYSAAFERPPSPAAMAEIGRLLFQDKSLSASGKLSCASCHGRSRGFGPPDARPVQQGGGDGRRAGLRAVPSLMYTQNIPPFTEHFFEDEGDDSIDQGPAGGRTWDGRSQSAHDQARLPLFSPFEMANASEEAVLAKVRDGGYAGQFRAAFGERVFEDKSLTFKAVLLALETYQQEPAEFYPYSSKYDAWLRHRATLTAQEARGLAAFNDPSKGNCARCHPSAVRAGAFPQFTDFGYAAAAVPRNAKIPANKNADFYDLGLCGPLRTDLAQRQEYCGMFRTPTLRNAALRRVFFHNGVFSSLEDVVRFYAQRDTQPQKWYPPGADGTARKFDDLPVRYQHNIDREPPFDRHLGDQPPFSESDTQDIVAFLKTLTDGYQP